MAKTKESKEQEEQRKKYEEFWGDPCWKEPVAQ